MARINLLPWRDELRKQYQQEFFISIGVSIGVALLVMLGVHFYIEGLKDYQEKRNNRIQAELVILDKKLQEIREIEAKKTQLLSKIEVIQKLQESRPEIVHLFEEMALTTPEGVYLTNFTQSGKGLTMKGKSQSNARVSAYMRAIEASEWVQNPNLNIIKSTTGAKAGHSNDFTMRAKQGKKKKKENEQAGGK